MYDERLNDKMNDTKPDVAASAVKRLVSMYIEWAFSPSLDCHKFKVVKVKGWGWFLVDNKSGQRMTVKFKWYQGLI